MAMELTVIGGILFSAFLCGSIPTGYIIVRAVKGIDIREVGSGNIGSTNVKRVAGSNAAIVTQVIDVLKGAIPVVVGLAISRAFRLHTTGSALGSITGLAAIVGHDFSPFLGFRGGKGVNTTVGSFVIIAPMPTAIALGFYFIFRLATGIVSVGSIALGITLPITVGCFRLPAPILVSSAIAGSLIIMRHQDNIRRLVGGEEREVD